MDMEDKVIDTSMSPEAIIELFNSRVCDYMNLDYNKFISPTRKREYVIPRQVAMYTIKNEFGNAVSLVEIGRCFGGRDHSTVIHGINCTIDAISIKEKYVVNLSKEFERLINNLYFINKESMSLLNLAAACD